MKKIFSTAAIVCLFLLASGRQPVHAAVNRTINFDLSSSRAVPKNIHGVNTNWLHFLPIGHNTTKAAIEKLGFNQLRFPGGTDANYYDWVAFAPNWDLIYTLPNVPSYVKNKPYFDVHVKQLSPLTFDPAGGALGAETTYVVNLSTNTPDEVIGGLQRLKNNGITIKRIEMGNENYFEENAPQYLDRAKKISDKAKQLWPGVKTALVIDRDLWIERHAFNFDIPNENWYDAVIVHAYSAVNFLETEGDFVNWVTGNENTSGSRRNTFDTFVNTVIQSKYPGKELWLTEWDLSEIEPKFKHTFAQTYYVYDFLLGALQYPVITVANQHSLNSILTPKSTITSQYFNPSNFQPVPNNQYSFDQFFVKQEKYWPMVWIGQAFTRNKFAIGTTPNNDVTAVYFYFSANPTHGSVALINKTGSTVKVTINGVTLGSAQYQLATLAKPWSIKSGETNEFTPATTTVSANNITLPPYAIAYLSPQSGAPTQNPADLNQDGKVDIYDYNLLVTDFGKTGSPGWIKADIIKDGKVDIFDYNVLVENFGK